MEHVRNLTLHGNIESFSNPLINELDGFSSVKFFVHATFKNIFLQVAEGRGE